MRKTAATRARLNAGNVRRNVGSMGPQASATSAKISARVAFPASLVVAVMSVPSRASFVVALHDWGAGANGERRRLSAGATRRDVRGPRFRAQGGDRARSD